MIAPGIVRAVLFTAALCVGVYFGVGDVLAQDVGVDPGGGGGLFRAKNPETKKKSKTGPTTPKPSNRTKTSAANIEDRVEDLLDSGNGFRDSRNFAEAETAYQGVLKLKPRDPRGAYGLGNVYSDQQRWDDAEAAYRNAIQWSQTMLMLMWR
jgi:tetratricopeptide (TPR) repeat protein